MSIGTNWLYAFTFCVNVAYAEMAQRNNQSIKHTSWARTWCWLTCTLDIIWFEGKSWSDWHLHRQIYYLHKSQPVLLRDLEIVLSSRASSLSKGHFAGHRLLSPSQSSKNVDSCTDKNLLAQWGGVALVTASLSQVWPMHKWTQRLLKRGPADRIRQNKDHQVRRYKEYTTLIY